LFLLGGRRGSWFALLMLAVIGAIFAVGNRIDGIAVYSNNLMIRFVPTYLTVYLFALVTEKSRAIVQRRLETSKIELENAFREVNAKTAELTQANHDLQREIGERWRAEKALRDSEAFLDDVIESIQDGICVLDPDLSIRHTNGVMRTWYAANLPLVGRKCFECFHNREQACETCPTVRSLKTGRTEREIVAGLPGSAIEWLELYSFPIKDKESGVVAGVVEFVRDITERKRLEDQLALAQRMDSIGRLAGGVAHDFNNILLGIQGRTSLMLADVLPAHPFAEHLKGIETYVKSAAQLTGQLLGFARGGKYEVQVTDLNRLISENLAMFGRTRKELRINSTFQEDLWPAEVDRGQINQVFLNLFVNAWEAMPHGGELTVTTENRRVAKAVGCQHGVAAGRFVEVTVTDTGGGMSEATRQRVFDPFFTTKTGGKGTGLGLASAYGIVKSHQGFITVESQPGRGARFSVFLPVVDKPLKMETERSGPAVNGTETILLVDDEKMVIDVGGRLLQKLGYQVLTAQSARNAVDLYTANRDRIDCVILDMVMPDRDGGWTFDRLKAVDGNVKVLLASGYSRDGQAVDILNRGCSGFIQKPFTLQELSVKIRSVLDPPPADGV
jgi:PAS domain S-box-containing protein